MRGKQQTCGDVKGGNGKPQRRWLRAEVMCFRRTIVTTTISQGNYVLYGCTSCASELSGLQGFKDYGGSISPRRRGIETTQPARRVASLEVAMSRKRSQGGLEDTTGRKYRETNLGNVANPKPR